MKTYGQTFLTRTRFLTTDELRVRRSWLIWRKDFRTTHGHLESVYRLTLLGIINSVLSKFPGNWRLYACMDEDTGVMVGYKFDKAVITDA